MKQLKDLPNTNGFKFTGIDLDGERIPCVVKLDPVGNHGVYDQRDGSPCFFRLYGWQPSETEGVLALVKQKRDEYRSFLDAGKGTWPGSDYIQDETWARWQGAWSVLDSIVSQAERERPCLFDKLVGNPLDGFPSTKEGEQT